MSDFFISTESDGSHWVTLQNYLELEKKFREFTNYVYDIVSVQCNDVGETHFYMQKEVEAIRQSGLTQRALDVCPECAGVGTREYYEGVLPCVLCDGTGKRQ